MHRVVDGSRTRDGAQPPSASAIATHPTQPGDNALQVASNSLTIGIVRSAAGTMPVRRKRQPHRIRQAADAVP